MKTQVRFMLLVLNCMTLFFIVCSISYMNGYPATFPWPISPTGNVTNGHHGKLRHITQSSSSQVPSPTQHEDNDQQVLSLTTTTAETQHVQQELPLEKTTSGTHHDQQELSLNVTTPGTQHDPQELSLNVTTPGTQHDKQKLSLKETTPGTQHDPQELSLNVTTPGTQHDQQKLSLKETTPGTQHDQQKLSLKVTTPGTQHGQQEPSSKATTPGTQHDHQVQSLMKTTPGTRHVQQELSLKMTTPGKQDDQQESSPKTTTPWTKREYNDTECNVPRFDQLTKPDPRVACKRLKPLKNSCKIFHDLLFSKPKDTCPQQNVQTICEVIKDTNGASSVKCFPSICKSSISLGIVNANRGVLEYRSIQDIAELTAYIQTLVEQPLERPHYGFCFIKCSLKENSTKTDVNQLLLLPPQIAKPNVSDTTIHNRVNINVIWLDSVSYSQFMRSMPATIESLKSIKKQKDGYVFSYNLVQALYGHTFETSQALFSGLMYQKVGNLFNPKTVKTDVLLQRYKKGGYETLWFDDLCWEYYWGGFSLLIEHVNAGRDVKWKMLQNTLRQKGIDRIDLALSNCEILKTYGKRESYYVKPVCLNGKYQTSYMLSYLAELQKKTMEVGRPFFHLMDTNVAHEDNGRRLQTFDEDLAEYFQFVSKQDNMLTLLFADHGVHYGNFYAHTKEAHVEKHHPALIIHASKNLPQLIGEDKMKALALNQDRLVNVIDLHYALHALAPGGSIDVATKHAQYDIDRLGLLAPINVNRTCTSIPRLYPNVCICEGFDTYVSVHANDTKYLMVAEFALGEINNLITSQFKIADPGAKNGFGSCQRLSATRYGNVNEHYEKDALIIQLDIYLPAGKNTSQDEDVFSVTVQIFTSHTKRQVNRMVLLQHQRTSKYDIYEACRDSGVDKTLCVCSLLTPITKPNNKDIPLWHIDYPRVFNQSSTIKRLGNSSCLYLYERRTLSGIILEAASECSENYYLLVDAHIIDNIYTSLALPRRVEIKSGDMVFLLAFLQNNQTSKWNVEYTVKYEEIV